MHFERVSCLSHKYIVIHATHKSTHQLVSAPFHMTIPRTFTDLIELDRKASASLAKLTTASPTGMTLKIRTTCLIIEWSLHGIPWLIGASFATLWAMTSNTWEFDRIHEVNVLLLALLVDLVVVGMLKIAIRRSRPEYNKDDQVYEAPIADKFAFPSGHCTRAAMLLVLLIKRLPLPFSQFVSSFCATLLMLLVAFSRVILGRHFITDVIAGSLIGLTEGFAIHHDFATVQRNLWNPLFVHITIIIRNFLDKWR